MDQPAPKTNATKPEWAQTRKERERQALLAAGLKPRRFPWLPVIGVVVLAGAAAIVVPMLDAPKPEAPEVAVEQNDAAPVVKQVLNIDTATAAPQKLQDVLKATGSLSPKRSLAITSQVNGTVEQVVVRVGDKVKAGDLLVQVDVETSTIQLRQQRATAAATRAQLAQAQSQLERSLGLAERGLTPDATVESERASIDALKANLEALEAGVASAEINIRNATVAAPFDGVVSARSVEPGQVVGAGAQLVEVVDLSAMEMTAYVPVSASPRIVPGQNVTLAVEGLGEQTFAGAVEGISPIAAEGTRTVRVLVSIDNPDGLLRGGMFATGQIVTDEKDDAIAVPQVAIREDDGGTFVLVIEDGKLVRQAVTTGRGWNGGATVELTGGLASGTTYISGKLDDLQAGMPVTVVGN